MTPMDRVFNFMSDDELYHISIPESTLQKHPSWYFSMLCRHSDKDDIITSLSQHDLNIVSHYFDEGFFKCPYMKFNAPENFSTFDDLIDFLGFDLDDNDVDWDDAKEVVIQEDELCDELSTKCDLDDDFSVDNESSEEEMDLEEDQWMSSRDTFIGDMEC